MKRRRELELLLSDIRSLLGDSVRAERDFALSQAVWDLSNFTKELLSLAERTDSRSTAFNALNALVETGTISEFEALDRMDDWKSRHR